MERLAEKRFVLADGRHLSWGEYGDPAGHPIVAFHGSPGSRLDFAWADELLAERGLRLLAPDRPGHGGSDDVPDRKLVDHADDVVELVDHLGAEKLSLLGFSGGGPYALSSAITLGTGRVERTLIISGAGRMDIPGAFRGVSLGDKQLTWIAMHIPTAGRIGLGLFGRFGRIAPRVPWQIWFSEVRGRDRELLTSMGPPRQAMLSFHEAFRQGAAGVIRDFQVLTLPFGFNLADVPGPVLMWHGAEDPTVPLHQAEDIANHVPGAQLEVIPEFGHLLIRACLDQILDSIDW